MPKKNSQGAAPELILLTEPRCKGCQDLKARFPKLAEVVREVDLLSDEGVDLGMELVSREDFEGVPMVLEKQGKQIQSCNIELDGKHLLVNCPSRTERIVGTD